MTQTILTQLEFNDEDYIKAEKIAAELGYKQTVYTSTSALVGLYCLKETANDTSAVIIKTKELGFLVVQGGEDLNLGYMFEEVTP